MGGIAKQNGMIPKCIGGVSDHVHLLVTLPTRLAIAKAVPLIKAGSSAWIHQTSETLLGNRAMAHSALVFRRFRKRSIEQQLEYHRTRTFQEEYLALRNTGPISTRNTSGISCARSYRTLRDGSFEGRFPRHFVPGYDRGCPSGTFRNRLSLAS